MPVAPAATDAAAAGLISAPFDHGLSALLMQLMPILVLFIFGGGSGVVCGFIAYHLAKTRRINRVCATFAGIFGGIAALFLIGMLERTTVKE